MSDKHSSRPPPPARTRPKHAPARHNTDSDWRPLAVIAAVAFVVGTILGASGPVHRVYEKASVRLSRGVGRILGHPVSVPPPADGPAAIYEPPDLPHPEGPVQKPLGRPFVLIVIDDIGAYRPGFKELLPLSPDLTFSVLPNADGTDEALGLLQADGRQYMLHMPMEYKGWPKPDPCEDCLLRSMPDDEIEKRVKDALVKIRPVGMNNHMGSAMTSDPNKIRAALKPLVGTGLFFLDSRTIGSSKAYEVAIDLGIPALGRNVFLDDDPAEPVIEKQYAELIKLVKKHGHGIAIGHPKPGTISVLKRHVPELKKEGIDLVRPADYFARLRWLGPDTVARKGG